MSADIASLQQECWAAYETAGYVGAAPFAEQILALADRWWLSGNADALLLRAQMRYLLARACLDRGVRDEGYAHVSQGLRAVRKAEALGDQRAAQQHVLLLLVRGESRMTENDLDGALADYAEAERFEDESAHPDWGETQVHLKLAQQYAQQEAGQYDESLRLAQEALELATEHEPRLVPAALQRMALVRRLTGAGDDGDHHLQAAAAIGQTQDIGGPQRAELSRSLASRSLEVGDLEGAATHLDDAEREFLAIGDERRAAYAGVGRADILRQRGEHDAAVAAARAAIAQGERLGEVSVQIEGWTVVGMTLDDSGRSREAVDAHDEAHGLADDAGDVMELLRIDVRRAVAAYNAAARASQAEAARGSAFGQVTDRSFDPHGEVADMFGLAVDIAVPAALAADAIRFDMEPGATRESWTSQVSMPVNDLALRGLTILARADEIVALLEYAAASAALDPEPCEATATGEQGRLPDRLDPPPYVRTEPDGGSAIDWALRVADQRYDMVFRSDEEVTAW